MTFKLTATSKALIMIGIMAVYLVSGIYYRLQETLKSVASSVAVSFVFRWKK